MTECTQQPLLFQPHARREVVADFDGGAITSDAGGLLLREVEQRFGILRQFAGCFTDHRDEELIEFSVDELLQQRVMGLALGYEDLNDHEQLRHDPLLALLCGRQDITGQDRLDPRDRGKPLAGKSTLNRLELTPAGASDKSRYKKIVASIGQLQDALVDVFIRLRAKQGVPEELILDFDATDDPLHGDQLGKFFHASYKNYCYLPLYCFCEGWPLLALLRPSNIDACAGTVQQLSRIVPRLRAAWPHVRIIVRAAAEDWRTDPRERAAGGALTLTGVPVPGAVRADPVSSPQPRAGTFAAVAALTRSPVPFRPALFPMLSTGPGLAPRGAREKSLKTDLRDPIPAPPPRIRRRMDLDRARPPTGHAKIQIPQQPGETCGIGGFRDPHSC